MKPSKLPALKRGVSRLGFIPEDVIPALKGGVYASAINWEGIFYGIKKSEGKPVEGL